MRRSAFEAYLKKACASYPEMACFFNRIINNAPQ